MIASFTSMFVMVTVGYLFFVALLSRRHLEPHVEPDRPMFYVFFVPALDEERVIANTLDSLMALPATRTFTVVIDDGSTDRTAEIVRRYPSERVRLFQRVAPNARQGKGAALNAAYRDVCRRVGVDADRVVIGVVDADGRLEPDALGVIDDIIRMPRVGAVQLMVRIFNRDGWLTRFQDFEFVSFSALLQRGRQHLGSVGLGGNGQFVRLEALQSLGDAPWTDCLTEDLDLGIRLAMKGWDNRFTSDSVVSQQGVTDLRVLWRQRTRWIHGHMQCWGLAPAVVRSDLPTRTVADLLYYLAAPIVLALASILFTVPLVVLGVHVVAGVSVGHLGGGRAFALVCWYLVAFAPAILLGAAYQRTARDTSLARSMLLSHLLLVYNYIWYAAVWRALARIALRRSGWVKTARLAEADVAEIGGTR
jgi:cellulose synthase/poly-beta-1,6-N-acetylglucosamine synthase-like glycosyltransferase